MTDEELVERAKGGDQTAFGELVVRYQNKIYTLCVRTIGDRDEGADLAQEAFFKAWQAISSFQGESSFSTWLYRLTINVCLDAMRKRSRRQSIDGAISLDDDEQTWQEPADFSQEPQQRLEKLELQDAVERGLQELPEHHRRPLILREISGLSYQEIAKVLDLDLGTVKSRIARARLHLRKILLRQGNIFQEEASNDKERTGER